MVEKTDKSIPLFHLRFNIKVSQNEAQQRFVNRVLNMIEGFLPELEIQHMEILGNVRAALISVATALGLEYQRNKLFSQYAGTDFQSCLRALDGLYQTYSELSGCREHARKVEQSIQHAISLSETDLGVEWRDGAFWPSGAKLLDEELVNENLKWLADKGYNDVLVPFKKGLRDFLEARNKPERLGDTVTDIYEALEALAKVVTSKDTDLSGNAELFISKLKLNEYYKTLLKNHIEYACEYRHAAKLGKGKKPLKHAEVEAFIYLTGLFMRLAIQQLSTD